MLSNYYFYSIRKVLKKFPMTKSSELNIRVTQKGIKKYKVSLLTIKKYWLNTTISTFNTDDLVEALQNPNKMLAKVLSEEKSPRKEDDFPYDDGIYSMDDKNNQESFFCDILKVIY